MGKMSLTVDVWFSSHAVLQRDKVFVLRGQAEKEETVTAGFFSDGKAVVSRSVKSEGGWQIEFPAMKAGGPYQLIVTAGEEKYEAEDLYFGDVWVLAGQSNMQLPVERVKYEYPDVYAKGTPSVIRQFCVPIEYDFSGEREFLSGGQWITGTPESIRAFSAVGYFFAEKLYQTCGIPMGLVLTAVGGTPVKTWMSTRALAAYPAELQELEKHKDEAYCRNILETEQKAEDEWYREFDRRDRGLQEDWLHSEAAFDRTVDIREGWSDKPDLCEPGAIWLRTGVEIPEEKAGQSCRLSLGTLVDADKTYVNGEQVGEITYRYPPREYTISHASKNMDIVVRLFAIHGTGRFTQEKKHRLVWNDGSVTPLPEIWKYARGCTMPPLPERTFLEKVGAAMYQPMFAPLHHYPVKGICWYQGESDTWRGTPYAEYFRAMVEDWREQWKEELPVLYVQLPNYDLEDAGGWVEFRNMQQELLKISNTSMVVTMDVGEDNDLHPVRKKPVGERLALAALKRAYGEKGCLESPIFKGGNVEEDRVVLEFFHTGEALKTSDGRKPSDWKFSSQTAAVVRLRRLLRFR